jgi:hypothetical protein
VYGIFCLENGSTTRLSRNVGEFYEPASPRVPHYVNQLPSSVTSRVSLLSAVAMASVWWKLVVT